LSVVFVCVDSTHLEHDLSQSDREALKHAATQLGSHTWIGGFVGTGLGCVLVIILVPLLFSLNEESIK
jgi:hypothetical protein